MQNLCQKQCSNCSNKKRCGGCSLCEASICDRNCKMCGTICIKRGKAVVFANKIISKKENLIQNKDFNISYHIPIIPDRLKKELDINEIPLVGIHGGVALSQNGINVRKIYRENGFKKALNLNKACKGILEFYVKDRTLEGIWKSREQLYSQIKEQEFEAVIAPNFSLYEDAPRIEHLYNIQRSITVYNELINYGINAIPDIAWYNINDLDFWIEQINMSGCKVIAFSFQVVDVKLKASNNWKNYLAGFKYLCKQIKGKIKIIVVGLNSETRISAIKQAITENITIHILNQSAYVQSQRGMCSEGRVQDIKTDKHSLLCKNIKYFNNIYFDLNNGRI